MSRSTITIIGTGCGVADLLPLRAQRALDAATVIAVDPAVDELDLPAGNAATRLTATAERSLDQTLVQRALAGERVVWVVPGDPTERAWQGVIDAAERQGIACEILPAVRSQPQGSPRPLEGQRVLVTRPRHQAGKTCGELEALGAVPICMPTIEIEALDPAPLLDALQQIARYDLLVLTSANGVPPLGRALSRLGRDARALSGLEVLAIGPGTAKALEQIGVRADLMPDDHRAEGVLELLGERVAGKRVLLARAEVARELLPEALRQRGAIVDLIAVYRTVRPAAEQTRLGLLALRRQMIDVITLTSASTAENLAATLGDQLEQLTASVVVAAIGPVTAEACARIGLHVDVMPNQYTIPAMVEAVVAHLARRAARQGREGD